MESVHAVASVPGGIKHRWVRHPDGGGGDQVSNVSAGCSVNNYTHAFR